MTTICQATLSDVDELESLYNDLNDYFIATENYPGWIKNEYPTRKTALAAIESQTLYVLRIDDVIAGAVILNHRPENAYQLAKWAIDVDYCHILVIHTLAVHPKFMKRGIAAELMEFAKRHAVQQGMKAIRLDTSITNLPAIRLYEKLGYCYVGEVDLELNLPGFVWFRLYEMVL